MKKRIKNIKSKLSVGYKVLLFVFAIVSIVLIFPREGKFRYEYQLGKPWLHDNLIAPYTFAVHKLGNELEAEKDSIRKNMKLYFRYDTLAFRNVIDTFEHSFNREWENYISTNDSLKILKEKEEKTIEQVREEYLLLLTSTLRFIYSRGILEINDDLDFVEKKNIYIFHKNIAEQYDYNELFTQKLAYEYLLKEIETYFADDYKASDLLKKVRNESKTEFIKKFQVNVFVQSNLSFDKETTQKVQNNSLDNISLTRGIIQVGEGIIQKGEVVTRDSYRIIESLRSEYETSLGESNNYWIYIGQGILVSALFLMFLFFLIAFRRDILRDNLRLSFILLMLTGFIILAGIAVRFRIINLYIIPFAILPIIIRTFFEERLAFMIHIIAILCIGFIVPNSFEFTFLQFFAGGIAIFSLNKLQRRGQVFATSVFVILIYSFIYFGMRVTQEADIANIGWRNFIWFVANGIFILAVYPLIYVFERLFGFVSDVTLIELSDLNHPLLRKLAEKAPGTFQHSIQVANLAEDAIRKIGGNPLLVRTGALYHDIGKMKMPYFFTENQGQGGNPHDKLEFDKSAEIIINHVENGIEIARKHHLPLHIETFIRSHHGNSKVLYFYRSFKNKYPDEEVDESKFTYSGPTPFSKETAVLMMADAIEAASRSLKTYTEEAINDLVENIIDFQTKENQYYNADITFKNITKVKEVFKSKLKNIYHGRIEYPKENE